jgi:CRP-like cAMP-binding protein
MERVPLDAYVLDALMPDLIGHDRRPSAFIVYLYLWRRSKAASLPVCASHQMLADGTGLSKGSVQAALRSLKRRQLIEVKRRNATAAPVFTLRCHWRRD